MDAVQKDLVSRRAEIQSALELLFKANMKITDWDVPEANDREAATILVDILQEKLDTIRKDVQTGKYNNY